MIYDFLEAHWSIVKWVVLGAVIFEVIMIFKMLCRPLGIYELYFVLWGTLKFSTDS